MKLTRILLLFLSISIALPESRGPFFGLARPQEKSRKANGQRNGDVNFWIPGFWDSLSMVPVKFTDIQEDNLTAQFSSSIMVQQINFKLPPPKAHAFFKLDGEWEKEIDRKEFLKKFKNDFWLVIYFPEKANLINAAHQIKSSGALSAFYAHDNDNIMKSAETLAYWMNVKIKLVFFYSFKGDTAYWIFLSLTDDPFDPVKDNKAIMLDNGTTIQSRVRTSSGQDMVEFRVLEKGIFLIDKNCTFNTVEIKSPKPGISKVPFIGGGIKTRTNLVSRDYFVHNAITNLWVCFYDKETQALLRIVEFPGHEK